MVTLASPVVLDTDLGVDDALALMLAVRAHVPLCGVTAVYGNASLQDTTTNALSVLELLGADLPVYPGASRPLIKESRKAECHGDGGLGGWRAKDLCKPQRESAQSFLRRQCQEQRGVTVVCIGPLTNLAGLVQSEPEIAQMIQRVVIMGGVIGGRGNITPYAEFNAWSDPDAFAIVLGMQTEKILIPANVCRTVVFSRQDFDQIPRTGFGKSIRTIVDSYIRYYEEHSVHGGFRGGVMYDVLAVAYLLNPRLFQSAPMCIEINTTNGAYRGATVCIQGNVPNCLLVDRVDAERVKDLFFHYVQ